MTPALTPPLTPTFSPAGAARTDWDAVILGAGPAGALAAILLARRGLSVLLVERAAWPRDKVCGCCLSPGGTAALAAAGAAHLLADALPAHTLSLRTPGGHHTLPIPEHRILRRSTLDQRLVSLALSHGALFLPGTAARVQGDHVHLDAGTQPVRLHPKVILVADGIGGSSLRDCPWAAWRVAPSSRLGAGAILDHAPAELLEGVISMHVAPEGYAGLVRLPGGGACIAMAADAKPLSAGLGLPRLAERILLRTGADPACLQGAVWRGTAALTRRRSLLDHGRVLILGDAAGYVEPFTGEGMTWALQSALETEPFAMALLQGSATPGAWTRAHARMLRPRRLTCSVAAFLARHPTLLRSLASTLALSSAATSLAGRLFAGRPRTAGSPA